MKDQDEAGDLLGGKLHFLINFRVACTSYSFPIISITHVSLIWKERSFIQIIALSK